MLWVRTVVAVAGDGSKRAAETCSGTRMQTSGGLAVPGGMSLRHGSCCCEGATKGLPVRASNGAVGGCLRVFRV